MLEKDFEKWLRLGLGRAVLFLKQNHSAPYRDAILYACLHDQRYDRQCEDIRGTYLYDLIVATGEPAYYRDKIIAALYPLSSEGEGAFQRMEIVRHFAAAGDQIARVALYTAFLKNAQLRDYRGAGELIELDGMEGFTTVLTTYLQTVGEDKDIEDVGNWMYDLEEREGKETARELFTELREQIPAIGECLAAVQRERASRQGKSKLSRPKLDYASLSQLIDEYCAKPRDNREFASASRFRSLGKRATAEALARISVDTEQETDELRLLPMLRLFGMVTFPGNPVRLITLAGSENGAIARAAMQALENVSHPEARTFAFELMKQPRFYGHAVDILTSNFVEGDYSNVEPLLRQEMGEEDFHSLGISVKDMVEKFPRPEAIPSLQWLYENGPCGLCRSGCVELLDQLGALPKGLRAECCFDASPHTREWIAEQDAKVHEATLQADLGSPKIS